MMKAHLKFLLVMLCLLLSHTAFAHPAPFPHAEVESTPLHLLLHTGITLAIGVGVFLLSRWLISWMTHRLPKSRSQRRPK